MPNVSPRVLIIEDETVYAQTLASVLDSAITCDIATDETTALAWLDRADYGMLIVDLALDHAHFDIAREAFCEQIRRRFPQTPVIGITGRQLTGAQIFDLHRYLDAFFVKQEMSLASFRSTVEGLLRSNAIAAAPRTSDRRTGMLFVSFSDRDRAAAGRLTDALRAAGLNVWWAGDGLGPGERFVKTIGDRLEEAVAFLLVWSEGASRSGWVAREMEAAIDMENSAGRPAVILVRLDQTPVPLLLRSKQSIDLTQFTRGVTAAVDHIKRAIATGTHG